MSLGLNIYMVFVPPARRAGSISRKSLAGLPTLEIEGSVRNRVLPCGKVYVQYLHTLG